MRFLVLLGIPAVGWLVPVQDRQPGLVAEFKDGRRHVVSIVPTPNFTLAADQSIHPQVRPAFSAVFTGTLRILRAGTFTLSGQAKIFLDDREIQGKLVPLAAGERKLRIEYVRPEGEARLQIVWSSDSFKTEPIPASAFGHRERPKEFDASQKIERGRDLVERRQCAACHTDDALAKRSTPLPSLANASWIYAFLDKHYAKPDDRADLAAFLGAPETQEVPADEERIRQGKELYESIGCQACHGELEGLGSKTTAGRLSKFLAETHSPPIPLARDEALALAEHLVQSKTRIPEARVGDAKKGQKIFESGSCSVCHGTATADAPSFGKLTWSKDCAHHRFSEDEKDELRAFQNSRDVSAAPVHAFYRSVKTLQCTACHEFHGPASATLADPPPSLSDAGNKLRESWVDAVLTKKKRIRPWMALRMPNFSEADVKPLVQGFARAAGAPLGDGEPPARPTPEQLKGGIQLIGKGDHGLSCITCHDFAGNRSLGTRGPDMTQMAERLRPDWFRRWMREPSRIQPGTTMPQFFGSLPEAEVENKLDLLWACLSAGRNMPTPVGLTEAQTFHLLAKDEPVLIRTFMPGSSPRSIAVGFPSLQSYCFDAGACRLRYAWYGDFLDVTPVWAGRGGEPARLLGKKYYTAPKSFPLRVGDPEREPKVKFLGYDLVDKIPVFRYQVDGVSIRQKITPVEKGLGLVMTFECGEGELWYVSEEEEGVRITPPGKFKVTDRKFTVTIQVDESK
jgi:mono/diheme cytochrome c family protein